MKERISEKRIPKLFFAIAACLIIAVFAVIFIYKNTSKDINLKNSTASANDTDTAADKSDKNPGSTGNANISNGGICIIQGGWIYFVNGGDNNKLYKINSNGTGKIKLCDDISWYLNAAGGWVYYFNASDSGKLYRIRDDGTERQKLNDDKSCYINVVGDWIYYCNASDDNKLYKIRTDGTARQKLNDDGFFDINVVGDWIYYKSQEENLWPYKVRTDGTDRQEAVDGNARFVIAVGDLIYFTDDCYNVNICRAGADTSDNKIIDIMADDFNISGDWIFYSNVKDDGKIYRIRTDGIGIQKLNDESSYYINIAGNWIYYRSKNDNTIYRMKIDGTEIQRVL